MYMWNDNPFVGIESNLHLKSHCTFVTRRVQNIPNCSVPQPHVIHANNKGMDGVDLYNEILMNDEQST